MVNEERLRHMINISRFDTYDDKGCKPMTQYTRRDYVSLQLLKSFITGTITYGLVFGLWALYSMKTLMTELNKIDIKEFLTILAIVYAVFMVLYETATYIIYQMRYTAGRRKVKNYYSSIKKVNQIYEREEKLKTPGNKAWDS